MKQQGDLAALAKKNYPCPDCGATFKREMMNIDIGEFRAYFPAAWFDTLMDALLSLGRDPLWFIPGREG